MDEQAERARFETWISLPPYEADLTRSGDHDSWPGQCMRYNVQLAWEAWKEAIHRG